MLQTVVEGTDAYNSLGFATIQFNLIQFIIHTL